MGWQKGCGQHGFVGSEGLHGMMGVVTKGWEGRMHGMEEGVWEACILCCMEQSSLGWRRA